MIKGNPKTALLQPHSVVITQSTAKKYFGNEEAIGKTITLTADNNTPYLVTGVIKDLLAISRPMPTYALGPDSSQRYVTGANLLDIPLRVLASSASVGH